MAELNHKTKKQLQERIAELTDALDSLGGRITLLYGSISNLEKDNRKLKSERNNALSAMHDQAAAMGLMARNWPVPRVLSTTDDEKPY